MLALLQAVTNSAGNAQVKDTAPVGGGIKSLFGNLALNLSASAGTIGVQALANKLLGKGAAKQFTPAGQSRIGAELTRNPEEEREPRTALQAYMPALVVGAAGVALVVGGFFFFRKRGR